ncbi:MAG: hypothetical protein RDU25_06115 [Patescibacteria group bacterium]|nr:hypothetical protein [Patescibacteria group bacterium]
MKKIRLSYSSGWTEQQTALFEKLGKAIESSHEPVKGWEMTLCGHYACDNYIVAVLVESVPSWIALDPDGQQRVLRFAVAWQEGWAFSRPWKPEWRGWDYIPSATNETDKAINFVIAWYPKVRRETFSVSKNSLSPFIR